MDEGSSSVLIETICQIRDILEEFQSRMEMRGYRQRVRAEWSRAADFAELISLILFISGAFLSTILFVYHAWY